MKKTILIFGYLSIFLSTTGLLFKLQHWPGAGVMLIVGVALLNLGYLPLYFRQKAQAA